MRTPAELLAKTAYSFSPEAFTLSSGQQSNHYVNCRKALLDPYMFDLLGMHLLEKLQRKSITASAVAGVPTGGDALAQWISIKTGIRRVQLRTKKKDHGDESEILFNGSPSTLWLMEDVVTTGASVIRAIEQLNEAGFVVRGVFSLVDRNPSGPHRQFRGVPHFSLTTLDEILYAAGRLPTYSFDPPPP